MVVAKGNICFCIHVKVYFVQKYIKLCCVEDVVKISHIQRQMWSTGHTA